MPAIYLIYLALTHLVGINVDGKDGAKYLLCEDWIGRRASLHDGRLDKEANTVVAYTTGQDLCVGGALRSLNVALDSE